MTREQTRFFVLGVCGLAAVYAAARADSEPVMTVALIAFALVFLANIRVADSSHALLGPVWLRRAQWAFVSGTLLVAAVAVGIS